ncbi:hypothetical protein C7D72_30125, partial [Klebsiella pneumoniae]
MDHRGSLLLGFSWNLDWPWGEEYPAADAAGQSSVVDHRGSLLLGFSWNLDWPWGEEYPAADAAGQS